jgi:molybdenum cofactor synthesis domain-containing protein
MIRTAIVTISDSVIAGKREDKSGPALESRVLELGWIVTGKHVVPDETAEISGLLSNLIHGGDVDVILTTGGTGISARDVTPEATRAVSSREIPGFGEMMRAEGRKSTKLAPLSRGGAYSAGHSLIVNFPGSPKGAVESLNAIAELIPHAVDLLQGRTEHAKPNC